MKLLAIVLIVAIFIYLIIELAKAIFKSYDEIK